MTTTDPLLEAVEALTRPVVEHVAQRTDTGKWIKTHTTESAPLLTQLHDKVWPSGGNDANSKAAPNERSLADNNALHEYARITTQIADWVRLAGINATRDPIANLNRWYAAFCTSAESPAAVWYLQQLRGWAHHIRKMLDKPSVFTLAGACPVCGATEWGDMINGGGMRVLKVEYVLDDHDHPKDVNALCQACRVVWEGREAVEELADELNEGSA